jgi:hypothetical protein
LSIDELTAARRLRWAQSSVGSLAAIVDGVVDPDQLWRIVGAWNGLFTLIGTNLDGALDTTRALANQPLRAVFVLEHGCFYCEGRVRFSPARGDEKLVISAGIADLAGLVPLKAGETWAEILIPAGILLRRCDRAECDAIYFQGRRDDDRVERAILRAASGGRWG